MRLLAFCLVFAAALNVGPLVHAQTFTAATVPGIVEPTLAPIQASDGNLYVVAANTMYKVTPVGTASVFYTFGSSTAPQNFFQATDGNFYGIDGINASGVFRLTLDGVFTQLYNLPGTAEELPVSPLIQGPDGNFYGICAVRSGYGDGEVYKLTLAGEFSPIFIAAVGSYDLGSFLVQGSDGNFYGTIPSGSVTANGVFRLTPDGSYSVFTSAPVSDVLTGGPGGAFYGINSSGLFSVSLSGAFDQISTSDSNEFTETYPLFYAGDGNFYGPLPGLYGSETNAVYQITAAGVVTPIATFTAGYDDYPDSSVLEGSNGNFYGDTFAYQSEENPQPTGVLYQLTSSPPLPPPVQISLSPANVQPGQSATLAWNAVNATTDTMRVCFASGAWSGVQNYTGSTTVSQAAAGTYTYALTCGGIETNIATLTVGNGSTSSVAATPTQNPIAEGQTESFTVDVTGSGPTPTGTVQLALNNAVTAPVTLANGMAMLSVSTAGLAPAAYAYTVAYSGDSHYAGASFTGSLTVSQGQATTTTTLTAASQKLAQNGTYQLTATVTPAYGPAPTGTIALYESSGGPAQLLATVPLSNDKAGLSGNVGDFPVGNYYVYAVYKGNASDASSTSAVLDLTVYQHTSVTMTAEPNPIVQGNLIQLNATVTPASSGTVIYKVGSTTVATGQVGTPLNVSTAGVPLGTYNVQAYYMGGGFSLPSGASPPVAVTVIPQGSVAQDH